jgi:HK97 family phage major capsid protein
LIYPGTFANLFGRRVGRKLNSYMSNDVTDGLLAQITVGATLSLAALPTLDNLSDMQSPAQIDPSYLDADSAPAYMASPALISVLRKQVATGSGELLYPEIKDGKLLGLPLIANVDMGIDAGDVAVVCGSFKRGVLGQDAGSVLIRSAERYAELGQVFFGYVNRLGIRLVDNNALVALKLHA